MIADDTIEFGEEDNFNPNKLTHPYVTLFHLFFRTAAFVVYLLGGWFSQSFIGLFVTIVLLLSCDFWTVKNITGRLMVGLRWWNYIDEEGKSHWVFESRKGEAQSRINPSEAKIFWFALVGITGLWTLLFVAALLTFSFKWLLLVCIALVLNYANLYGYTKCKFGKTDDKQLGSTISTMTSDFIKRQLFRNITTPQPPTQPGPTSIV